MLKDLIGDVLPDLDDVQLKRLLRKLEDVGEEIAVGEVAKLAARGLVKGIDAFAKFAVVNLSGADSEALAQAYVVALQAQLQDLVEAVGLYVPLALDVETNKEIHGANSEQANAARKRRETGINEIRGEMKDVLLAAVGGNVQD